MAFLPQCLLHNVAKLLQSVSVSATIAAIQSVQIPGFELEECRLPQVLIVKQQGAIVLVITTSASQHNAGKASELGHHCVIYTFSIISSSIAT